MRLALIIMTFGQVIHLAYGDWLPTWGTLRGRALREQLLAHRRKSRMQETGARGAGDLAVIDLAKEEGVEGAASLYSEF